MYTRLSYTAGFVAVCGLLLTSVYLQVFQGLQPCPLCALQRVSFAFLGIWFLIGLFSYTRHGWRLFVNIAGTLTSILGLTLAGRQIWLQTYPPLNSGECGVSLQYMFKILPFSQVLQKVFEGSADCSERGW